MNDPWLDTVADESSPYQPTKKDVRVLTRERDEARAEVERLQSYADALAANRSAENWLKDDFVSDFREWCRMEDHPR